MPTELTPEAIAKIDTYAQREVQRVVAHRCPYRRGSLESALFAQAVADEARRLAEEAAAVVVEDSGRHPAAPVKLDADLLLTMVPELLGEGEVFEAVEGDEHFFGEVRDEGGSLLSFVTWQGKRTLIFEDEGVDGGDS